MKDPFGLVTQITHENKQILPRKEVSRRMRTYESKEALIEAIQIASQKYLAEFAEIPETLKDHRIETVAKTPSENFSLSIRLAQLAAFLGRTRTTWSDRSNAS